MRELIPKRTQKISQEIFKCLREGSLAASRGICEILPYPASIIVEGEENRLRMDKYPSLTYIRNLRLFSERTQELADKIFSMALQVLFLKYKRKRKEYETTLLIRKRKGKKVKLIANPLLLKEKDVSNAISLIDFHLRTVKEVDVGSNTDLTKLFGTVSLEVALKYYDEFLKKGDIQDVMGRKIVFDDNGKVFLYKEHTEEGRHVALPENYVEARGKRLSWIKPLLSTTREIYREVESYWETFLYVGIFKIRIDPDNTYEKEEKNHFLIITRKERGKQLRFITAYFMESQIELFRHLEESHPVSIEQQECIKLIERNSLTNR